MVDHRDYVAGMNGKIEDLLNEGVENMEFTVDAAENLADAAKTVSTTMKTKGAPAVKGGVDAQGKNVKWG